MNKLAIIKTGLNSRIGRGILIGKKYSPEILIVVGVAGIVVSTVMACKATLKLDAVIAAAEEKKEQIKDATDEFSDTYSEQDAQKDLAIVRVKTGVDVVKLYAPAVALGIFSIGCVIGSHNIMQKRNIALMAAYKLVDKSFEEYRKRVVEEFGEDKDRQYKFGIRDEYIDVVAVDEEGKKKKIKKTVSTLNPSQYSQYARFFDPSCRQWSPNPEYNMIFLKGQQNYLNDILHARGHVFLNEAYERLGFDHTKEGAIVGWVLGQGDDFIDFNIYNPDNPAGRKFVNCDESCILLDFNVDGVIYDHI